ncbi:MAG: LamG-like jellyroll fold domain-containing protein [Bacteroidota bacterium]
MNTKLLTLFLLCYAFMADAQISNDGLLAYYPFDGNVQDFSTNNYDGNLASGAYGMDENGNPNAALLLNGIDDYVDLSVFAPVYRDNLNKISIYFKIKFDKEEDKQTILSLGNFGESLQTNVFEIEYENDRFQVESETGTNAINHELEIDQQNSLFDGQWHQIIILLDGERITYCRDNEEIFKGVYIPSQSISTNLFLGCFGGTSLQSCCFFGGHIDELQFYDRLLSKEELIVSNSEILLQEEASIFPNPTNHNVTINLEKQHLSIEAKLMDIQGRCVFQKRFENTKQFEIDLPYRSGFYILHLQNQSNKAENYTFKIIRQ